MTIGELYNVLEKAIDCDNANLDTRVLFYNKEVINRNNYSCINDAIIDEDDDLILS